MKGLVYQLNKIPVTADNPHCVGVVAVASAHYVNSNHDVTSALIARARILLSDKQNNLACAINFPIQHTLGYADVPCACNALAHLVHSYIFTGNTCVIRKVLNISCVIVDDALVPGKTVFII
jgi:hypothetical protein